MHPLLENKIALTGTAAGFALSISSAIAAYQGVQFHCLFYFWRSRPLNFSGCYYF